MIGGSRPKRLFSLNLARPGRQGIGQISPSPSRRRGGPSPSLSPRRQRPFPSHRRWLDRSCPHALGPCRRSSHQRLPSSCPSLHQFSRPLRFLQSVGYPLYLPYPRVPEANAERKAAQRRGVIGPSCSRRPAGVESAPRQKRGRRALTPGPWHRAKFPQSRCGERVSRASGSSNREEAR